jgi:hypothetical protein
LPEDPEQLLAQAGLETALPGVLPAPGAPAPPGAAPPPAGAPGAPPGAPGEDRGGALRRGFKALWKKLTTPTAAVPADYRGRRLARIVNESLDGRGNVGNAAKAQVGESASLVAGHLFGGNGGAQTPLGHLAGSTGEFLWTNWEEAPQRAASRAEAAAAAAQRVDHQ